MIRRGVALAAEILLPVCVYYALRARGVSALTAVVVAGVPEAALILHRFVRQRRVDVIGGLSFALLAIGITGSLLSGSARFLLAKGGWLTGLIGFGFLGTLVVGRPLALVIARAILERTSMMDTLQVARWDELWADHAWFRRAWRVSTALWGVGLIADGGARVAMAYALPVDLVPLLGTGLWLVTFVLLQLVQHVYFKWVGLWRRLVALPRHGEMAAE